MGATVHLSEWLEVERRVNAIRNRMPADATAVPGPGTTAADPTAPAPPNATVSYQMKSRTGGGLQTLNIPNWEGTTDQVEIFWNDFDSLNF